MSWLQLRISTSRDQAISVEKALESVSALSITFEDNADQAIFEPEIGETPLWQETRVTGLFSAEIDSKHIASQILALLKVPEENLHWHVLEDKDWEREWMSHYHPIQCGEHFWVCPSWTEVPDPNAVNLMLDPGLAFGTGTHPTTFLCLQWLASQNFKGKYVVDYGCGSGILGIAALLLGAKKAVGVDIDPQALIATQENVKRNTLNIEDFPVFFPAKAPQEPSDFVLANILAGPLVELAPALIERLKPGAHLCLSGVLESQKEAILNAYSHAIIFDEVSVKDSWICLTGQRK